MEAQPKPLTAEDAGGAEDAGKSVGRGCFFESKSLQAAKTFMISTAEEAEGTEVFWGYHRELSSNLQGARKGFGQRHNPQIPLLPPLPLRFQVLFLLSSFAPFASFAVKSV